MSERRQRRVEESSHVKNSTVRLAVSGILLIIQIVWLVLLFVELNEHSAWISALTVLVSIVTVLIIYGMHQNSAIKMPWIMMIMAFPVVGIFLYLMIGRPNTTRKMRERYEELDRRLLPELSQDETVMKQLGDEMGDVANISSYLWKSAHYPVYRNTDVVYYSDGLAGLNAQVEDLKKAEKFIFMEYHAIEDAQAFGRMKKVLAERARAGVEVRLFYDDMGSAGFINMDFIKRMEELGIQCRVFNPISPILNIFMNNRDHRKITVIDGKVGFVGGYNLANEYFHLTSPYGFWKDTGLRLEGDAVRSLTVSFLENWNAAKKDDVDDESFEPYLPEISYQAAGSAYVQPYADSPLDDNRVGENVYISMLMKAKQYCYFVTPYLLLTDEMVRAFELAAKRGVDVRVVTPGIPDKKLVYRMTRSYYNALCRNGVRVYEYSPGFCHAKMSVSDDEAATVGTINLDYRSLYLHFENGCLLTGCDQVREVRKDFERMFAESHEVTEEYRSDRRIVLKIQECILRLFAPLM